MNDRRSWAVYPLVAFLWVLNVCRTTKNVVKRVVGQGCFVAALLAPIHAEALELVAQRVLLEHPVNLYSAFEFEGHLYLGAGPFGVRPFDEIYEVAPGCTPRVVLTRAGHHVNDPSVVRRPLDGAPRMYYTSAPYDAVNTISVAVPNGVDWQLHVDLIPDGGSPSALVVGGEVWVYYTPFEPGPPNQVHPAIQPQQVWRQRYAADGVTPLGGSDVMTAGGAIWAIGNIDVARHGAGFIAVGNRFLNEVFVAFSSDGINFGPSQLIVAGGGSLVTAPYVRVLDGSHFAVAFSVSFAHDISTHFTTWEWIWRIAGAGPTPAWPSQGTCVQAPPPACDVCNVFGFCFDPSALCEVPCNQCDPFGACYDPSACGGGGGGGGLPPPPSCFPWQTPVIIGGQTYCY